MSARETGEKMPEIVKRTRETKRKNKKSNRVGLIQRNFTGAADHIKRGVIVEK